MAGWNDRNVVLEGVRVIFRNFTGKEGEYNRPGERNFAALLDKETADAMIADGWNVKYLKPRESDEDDAPPAAYIPIAVGYKLRPPRVVMITPKGRTTLSEDEIELLDWADIDRADLILHPSEWHKNGNSGIKAYLQSAFFIIQPDPLEEKYADYLPIDDNE